MEGIPKEDKIHFQRNMLLFPPSPFDSLSLPQWEGSAAQAFLEIDIDKKKHLEMSPEEFWSSREVYKVFDKKVFRKDVHQWMKTLRWYNTRDRKLEVDKAKGRKYLN